MRSIDVPDELLDLLRQSRLPVQAEGGQVKAALAIHLFQEGIVSIGKAAELAGLPRVDFEWFLVELGIPVVQYDTPDDEIDRSGITEAIQHRNR